MKRALASYSLTIMAALAGLMSYIFIANIIGFGWRYIWRGGESLLGAIIMSLSTVVVAFIYTVIARCAVDNIERGNSSLWRLVASGFVLGLMMDPSTRLVILSKEKFAVWQAIPNTLHVLLVLIIVALVSMSVALLFLMVIRKRKD